MCPLSISRLLGLIPTVATGTGLPFSGKPNPTTGGQLADAPPNHGDIWGTNSFRVRRAAEKIDENDAASKFTP